MRLEQFGRGLLGLERHELVTLLFEAAHNVPDQTPLDTVRLDLCCVVGVARMVRVGSGG